MIGDEPDNTRKHPEASEKALSQGEGMTTDPGAFDLDRLRAHYELSRTWSNPDVIALIAEVEALRERVAVYGRLHGAAEARVVNLWNALDFMVTQVEDAWDPDGLPMTEARAALSATPAEAMERARAAEVVIVKARRLMNASSSGPFRGDARQRRDLGTALKDLAKLNTLKA